MAAKKKAKRRGSTPSSFEVPEEMRRWSALLSDEVASWPQVTRKKMFGMTSLYRKEAIFAALPDKKAYFSATSIIFKLQHPNLRQQKSLGFDPRINTSFGIGQKWYGYELASDKDIQGALEWLSEAFDGARKKQTA